MIDPVATYRKHLAALHDWLDRRGYAVAREAFDLAMEHHTGTRKDGITPEIQHQISIGNYLRTLEPHLHNPENTFAAAFLHDVREDYFVPDETVRRLAGGDVADAVEFLTKIRPDGSKKDTQAYFDGIAGNDIASIVKLADRIHNLQSMIGVFRPEKQIEYAREAETYFVPMLKTARRKFPRQEPAYENAKLMLYSQIALIKAIHAS